MAAPIYTVWVTTGTEALGGTDSNVFVMLYGQDGQTDWVLLPAEDVFAFEEGATDKFVLDVPDLGELTRCCVAHDNTADPGWFVETVRVQHNGSHKQWTFTFHAWVGEEEAGRLVVCADG